MNTVPSAERRTGMRKRRIRCLLFLVSIAGLSCGSLFTMKEEQAISSDAATYTIDAQTILQSLDQTNIDVFKLEMATPESTPERLPSVRWSQTDYYRVAQAFHEFVWQESLDKWKLNLIFFRLDCTDAALGPQMMSFDMFRMDKTREGDSRIDRSIYIWPQQNQLHWSEAEYYPVRFRKSVLDLTKVEIMAEEALRIAEEHGGRNARLASNNTCVISGHLGADTRYNGWLVSYRGEGSITLFEVVIDERTGEVVR